MEPITLKAARINAELTQKEAAKRLGVSNKTVCNWEKGKTFPDADMISSICELYNRPYDGIIFLPNNPL